MSLKHLTSKLLAGGLTAGIALIWWPTHYPTSGMEWLVARGVLATLGFELMFIAFSAVEDRVAARLHGRAPRLARLSERIARAPRAARTGFVLAAGGAALALPVTALVSAGSPLPHHSIGKAHAATKPERERVVRQVIVRRQVVHDEVVVTTPAAPSSAAAAPQRTTSTRATPRKAPTRTATTRTPSATTPATTTTTPAASAPGQTTTTTDTTAAADATSTAPTTTTP